MPPTLRKRPNRLACAPLISALVHFYTRPERLMTAVAARPLHTLSGSGR